MKLLHVFLLLFISTTIFAQNIKDLSYNQLDSMWNLNLGKGTYQLGIPYLEVGVEKATKEFGEMDSVVAQFYANLAFAHSKIGNYPKSLELSEKTLSIQRKIFPEIHEHHTAALNNLANLYNSMGQFDKSEKTFLQCIDIYKRNHKEKTTSYAIALNSLAFLYYNLGRYEETTTLLAESSKIWKETKGEKHPEYAKSLFNLGNLYQTIGRYEEAEPLFLKAGALWKEVLGDEHPNYAAYLTSLAFLYRITDRLEAAEALFLQTLEIRKKLGGEKQPEYAFTLKSLASLYQTMNKYEKSEKLSLQALELDKAIGGGNDKNYANGLSILANLYQAMNRYEESEKLFKQAVEIEKKIYGEQNLLVAISLANFAGLYLKSKKYKEAETLYLEAIEITKNVIGEKNHNMATSFSSLAYLYSFMGQYELSKTYYYNAILSNCKDTTLTRAALEKDLTILVNKNFHSTSQITLALDGIYRLTQTQLDSTGVRDNAALEYGYAALQVAMQISEKLRNSLIETGKLRLLKQISRLATKAIDRGILLNENNNPKYVHNSFSYAELNKSALLADALKGNRARTLGDLPDSLIFYEIKLENDKKKLEKEQAEAKDETTKQNILKKQNDLNLELDRFIQKIKNKYPKYHALKYENITAKAEDVQKLLDDKTMLLEYFVADSSTYLFVLTKKELKLHQINISKTDLNKEIGEFRNALSNYKFITEKKDKAYAVFNQKATWFYETLVKIALEKNKVENLIIVADGELGHLPFEAFLVEKGKDQNINYKILHYLVNDYNISYNYSATLLVEALRRPNANNNNSKMFAFAAAYPTTDSSLLDLREAHIYNTRAQLNPLPAVKKEVQVLAELFQGDFLQDSAANETFFKQNATNYGIIHLAMHGILNSRVPILSSLAFTENRDSLEDNFLHAYEISKLNLNANLVVLSACETGYGKFEQGEGVLSLARSFMYAGVPSLVVSLWQVSDGSTAAIMVEFYKNLAKGMPKDAALRQAKLGYIQRAEGLATHPAFWSAFIQLGDSRPIHIAQKGGGWYWYLGGGVLLVGALVVGFRRKGGA